MRKHLLFLGMIPMSFLVWSCNDNRNQTDSSRDDTSAASVNPGPDTMGTPTNIPTASTAPLNKTDSTFVMEAATGGMMEVEAGKVAQQNSTNQRIKDFASMMVTDHGKANQELMGLASSHGITVPASLPADMQKHIEDMKKMTGKSFDRHYVSMMTTDHQKVLAKFKKASETAASDDLKTWATNTTPVIQKHLDSVQAIKKMKL